MISANFTKGSDTSSKIVTIYELKVEKGCGKKTEIMENINKGKFGGNKVCIISPYNFYLIFGDILIEMFSLFRRKPICKERILLEYKFDEHGNVKRS